MKTLFFRRSISAFLLLTFFSLSSLHAITPDEEGWTLLKSNNNVEIFVKIDNCNGDSFYLFKVNNLTSESIDFEMIVDVKNEPAYGSMLLKESIAANSANITQCEKSMMKLPKSTNSIGDLSKEIIINIKE